MQHLAHLTMYHQFLAIVEGDLHAVKVMFSDHILDEVVVCSMKSKRFPARAAIMAALYVVVTSWFSISYIT